MNLRLRPIHIIALCLLVLMGSVHPAAKAPRVLGVQGDRFTVDGTPKFLTLVSYFDALDARDDELREDFAYFQAHGIDGVRIFPNWWDCADLDACKKPSPRTLMDAQGALRAGPLERLRQVLALAAEHDLLVDVSFARETVQGDDGHALSARDYEKGLLAVTHALANADARHVLFDLQNEVEINGLGASQDLATEVTNLRAKVRAVDDHRIVVTSTGSIDLIRHLAAQTGPGALDAIAYHDPRVPDWYGRTEAEVRALRAISARPIYFQEPIAYQLAHARPGRDDTAVEHFVQARDEAHRAGAAAWVFHTRKGFRLDERSFVAQQEPGERAFFATLAKPQ